MPFNGAVLCHILAKNSSLFLQSVRDKPCAVEILISMDYLTQATEVDPIYPLGKSKNILSTDERK